ncbi:uncharacterized protein [Malus domestica]|uniref:uncharacterized protein isoform X1 n=2 Tax=Malus domestica TaxID=3750 RepID=UPI003974BD37
MAAFDHVKDMYDVALRPRLLQTIIRDLPDDKHPSASPSELSKVVYAIKTHNLLCESVQDVTDQKLITTWKSAMDSWVRRLVQLVSSDMPDKCWEGTCLMGVTCRECSSERFLESYSGWFQILLSHIQQPTTTSQFVKVASCASMSDLITRLGGSLNAKRDGTAHAGKLVQQIIQPVLKLLNDDHSEVVWEGAVRLLCTIISFFPLSISRHYDSVEDVIASTILSGKGSDNMLKKLAYCLAVLPKSRGDEDSWSLMIQKILLLINGHLNDVFQGFEEETKRHEIIRLLIPLGKDPPPQLGGNKVSGKDSTKGRKSSQRLTMSSISALMVCCSTMITTSYPVQVTVPIRSLFVLIERVLIVDGSLPHSLLPFMTATQQEFICSELPLLHLYGLEFLTAIIEGVRSQLLPHAAYLVHLLSVYLKRCALPELRIKVYSITRILLISMGFGMTLSLAREVANNALIDLNPIVNESGGAPSSGNSKPSTEALLQTTPQSSHRKRKHGASSGSLEWHKTSSLGEGNPKSHTISPIPVKIAALEALEALVTVGGALKSEGWRSDVGLLLMDIATNSMKVGRAGDNKNIYQLKEPVDIWGDLQLAALRALLASLLSSSGVRPPYLAEGLDLFRRGKQETGTKVAGFCAHSLLTLEVLVHPRALPLAGFSVGVSHKLPENMYSGSVKHQTPFSSDIQGMVYDASDSDCDDLYTSWLATGKQLEAPMSDLDKTMQAGEPSKTLTVHRDKKLVVDGSFGKETLGGSAQELKLSIQDVDMRVNGDENMVESCQFQEFAVQLENGLSSKVASVAGTRVAEEVFGRVALGSGPSDQAGSITVTTHDVPVAKGDGFLGREKNSASTSNPEKGKGIAYELGNDSDADSFPDIVDPDSDSE